MEKWRVIYLVLVAILVAAAALLGWRFEELGFKPISAEAVVDLLTPLFVIALFLERALEVFVSSWRKVGRDVLERRAEKERQKENELALHDALDELARYKAETARIAFLAGLGSGVLIALAGVRVLHTLTDLDPARITGQAGQAQLAFFCTIDVLLTGGLLGGGSEGLHKLVGVVTDFLDQTRENIKK